MSLKTAWRHIPAIAVTLALPMLLASASRAQPLDIKTDKAAAMQSVLDYVQAQKTTGFLVIQDRKVLAQHNWPLPPEAAQFKANLTYGEAADGALMEDVASQQKSFVAVLAAIAIDKGLLDVNQPVSTYTGPHWSKATPEEEGRITVLHLMTMSSGLSTDLAYAGPAGSAFLYNTPAYAVMKAVLAGAAHTPFETLSHDWLTGPAGMKDTAWRRRPAALADSGNPTGLVITPHDVATFGQVVLDHGRAADGQRIVSEKALDALFTRSADNPAYGRLWWLNGSDYTIKPLAKRIDGPLIPAAPADLVAALGALDRKLYLVPSRNLIVVRMGQATDADFDQQLWLRLMKVLE